MGSHNKVICSFVMAYSLGSSPVGFKFAKIEKYDHTRYKSFLTLTALTPDLAI